MQADEETEDGEAQASNTQVPIGKVMRLGLLHVDQKAGVAFDAAALQQLLDSKLVVAREEVSTDMGRAASVFVKKDHSRYACDP